MGIRVARAVGKKQGKQRKAKHLAAKSRAAGSRAKPSRTTGRGVSARAAAPRTKRTSTSVRGPAKQRLVVAKAAPAKRAPAKAAPTKRTPAKRVVAKRTPTKRTPAKRTPAKRTPTKRVVAKAAPAKRTPAKRVVAKRTPATPVRHAVPVPPAFAAQRAHATAREHLLFELQRARTTVKAALQGLTAGTAERPIAPGKWSIKEIVLHLSERDRVRLDEFARTLAGTPRSWAGMEDPAMAPVNAAHLAALGAHTWDEAVRRLEAMREELMRRLHEVPAAPEEVWLTGHAFADTLWGLPAHDRHHAAQIKLARIGDSLPVEV
jgi:uncharacterized damage-inducible protein DinB